MFQLRLFVLALQFECVNNYRTLGWAGGWFNEIKAEHRSSELSQISRGQVAHSLSSKISNDSRIRGLAPYDT